LQFEVQIALFFFTQFQQASSNKQQASSNQQLASSQQASNKQAARTSSPF